MTALRPIQGFAAEASAATVWQVASSFGVPVSTTHAIASAIVGAGTPHGRRHVPWHVVDEIALSSALTLPATMLLGYAFAVGIRALLDSRAHERRHWKTKSGPSELPPPPGPPSSAPPWRRHVRRCPT